MQWLAKPCAAKLRADSARTINSNLSLLTALAALIYSGEVEPILPRIVIEEFARNKARVIEDSRQSLSSTLKRVKDVVEKYEL